MFKWRLLAELSRVEIPTWSARVMILVLLVPVGVLVSLVWRVTLVLLERVRALMTGKWSGGNLEKKRRLVRVALRLRQNPTKGVVRPLV